MKRWSTHLLLPVVLAPLLSVAVAKHQIFVATTGSDSNEGTQPMPVATLDGAARKLAAVLQAGLPDGGVEVVVASGIYHINESTALQLGHHYQGVNISGSASSPIVFRGARSLNGLMPTTILDGSLQLDATLLKPVTNATVLPIVNSAARGKLLSMPISAAAGALLRAAGSLQWGEATLTASRYPDDGLAYVQKVNDRGAVYAEGRTKGSPPHSSMADPIGANITLFGDADGVQPTGDWAAELAAGMEGASISGYFFADWYKQTQSIARAQLVNSRMQIKLQQYSRYGYCEQMEKPAPMPCAGTAPGRFIASGLLSEVTKPGEYHYDVASSTLFVLPPNPRPSNSESSLGVWSGPAAVTLGETAFVTVRDMEIRGVAQSSSPAAVVINGGHHNTIGGCVIHSSTRSGVALIGGNHNRFVGNDVFDVPGHVISGMCPTDGDTSTCTESNAQNLMPTNNLIGNNHFTQKVRRDFYGGIRLRGIGDRLSHNLAHDASGQYLTPSGPLTMIDSNEIFNTGYSEGDGGVMYSGMSLWGGYGMSYTRNFVHHSLEVPGLHGRGTFYFDGHQQATSNVSLNVAYKAAGRAFLVNGGAKTNITRNLIINSGIGIFNENYDMEGTPNYVQDQLDMYDNGTLKRGDVGDFVWRTIQAVCGPNSSWDDLFTSAMAKRFPTFADMMKSNSSKEGWASCEGCDFSQNIFLNNSKRFSFSTRYPNGSMVELYDKDAVNPPAEFLRGGKACIVKSEYTDAAWSEFPKHASLEFKALGGAIDTTVTGLRCDEFRRAMPVKSDYRNWARNWFEGVASYTPLCDPHTKSSGCPSVYTAAAASRIASMHSGAKLLGMAVACESLSKTDCTGELLPWGQCQTDGSQVFRFTVQQEAMLGGAPCSREDGAAVVLPCSTRP